MMLTHVLYIKLYIEMTTKKTKIIIKVEYRTLKQCQENYIILNEEIKCNKQPKASNCKRQ